MTQESRMTHDEIERLGQLIDTADNLLAATTLQLPPQMHVDGLKGGIQEMRAELLAFYLDSGGVDEWTDRDTVTP